jgi:RNA recognition motif-containing protein
MERDGRRSSRDRDGGRRSSGGNGNGTGSFYRARDRFERKRKNYPEERRESYEEDRGDPRGDRSGGRRRSSRSPDRWSRGKKQQKKTQTDVPPERELFVGNIPSSIDERYLLTFLNGAMRHANLCPRHETPCMSCQINAGNFAFVEMLNADYANKCLNLNGVLFLNSRIKVGRPKKYAGPFVVAKSWQTLTGESLTVDAVLDSEAEKVNRELFVGNTTPEMTDQMLMDFLGSAMEQVGLNIMDGNPINLCELFGKYAFIELRTPREAANALNLNNIPFMGSNLQITRPSKYQGKFEKHNNWEHVLARFNMKPEEFQLGEILNPSVLAATPNDPEIDGENINVVKAELAQIKRALEITRRQLDESNKKSEARKEQLVSLNKKWAEGKSELSERKTQLHQVKRELEHTAEVRIDMDKVVETQELKKRHEETQGMLRGVTESLVKATEKLQHERKARKSLEQYVKDASASGLNLNLEPDAQAPGDMNASIDFNSLRAEMDRNPNPTTPGAEPVAAGNDGDDVAMDEDAPRLEPFKEFLSRTPESKIDWGPDLGSSRTADADGKLRTRDRGGVRLCRLLIHTPDMNVTEANVVKAMASKYNLGGYVKCGLPGLLVIEGLEFNCDIFMDNMERQKKKYTKCGKVSERSGRAFPMEMTLLEGDDAAENFSKACASVSLTEKLQAAMSG